MPNSFSSSARRLGLWLLAHGVILGASAAEASEVSRPVRVGVEIAPPFVLPVADQDWGISVALWERIAEELGLSYVFVEHPEDDLLELVRRGEVDVAVTAYPITHEREQVLDFTHPYLTAGLAIASRSHRNAEGEMWRVFVIFGSPSVLRATLAVLGVVVVGVRRISRSSRSVPFAGRAVPSTCEVELFLIGVFPFFSTRSVRFDEGRWMPWCMTSPPFAISSTTLAGTTSS